MKPYTSVRLNTDELNNYLKTSEHTSRYEFGFIDTETELPKTVVGSIYHIIENKRTETEFLYIDIEAMKEGQT